MAAETDEAFNQALDDDLAWRRIELSSLKASLIEAARLGESTPRARGLSRALVAMCYAHWEGFAKNSFERYDKLVTRRKPSVREAHERIALHHLQRLVRRIESGDSKARGELISLLYGGDVRINIDKSKLADTHDNLRYATLTGLLELGGIDPSPFILKEVQIDKLLCDRRNSIAHGRDLAVTIDDSISTCDQTVDLLEKIHDSLINQVKGRKYLRSGSGDGATRPHLGNSE